MSPSPGAGWERSRAGGTESASAGFYCRPPCHQASSAWVLVPAGTCVGQMEGGGGWSGALGSLGGGLG